MWQGLDSLKVLSLYNNDISEVPEFGFSNLPSIEEIYLIDTNLTTLEDNIFDPDLYPDSDGHPENLTLHIGANPLQCDCRMCWIKQAQEDGWMHPSFFAYSQKPDCANYPDREWKDIDLDC